MDRYDVIVIGTGGGNKIAFPAAAQGLRIALIDHDSFGGTCLNRGCIPSKMLIYPAEVLATLRHGTALNMTGTDAPGMDFSALIDRCSASVDDVSRTNAAAAEATPNLDLFRGTARFVDNHTVQVDGRVLSAPRIFIAVGMRPAPLEIQGSDTVTAMSSREALRRRELPQRLIVIGAGYIACELGFAYGTFGSDVQFIVRSRYLRQEDDEISTAFNQAFSERFATHHGVPIAVSQDPDGTYRVTCQRDDDTTFEVTGDALLTATGQIPNTDTLDLGNTDIDLNERGFIVVDDHLQTSVDGVYALGDCIGRYFYRHTVNVEGEYLVESAIRRNHHDPLDYPPVPHAVFTHPQVAGVGLKEREVAARGTSFVVGRATYADSTPGMARASFHGLAKVIVDRDTGRLLGAHMIGENASDIIHLFISAMTCGATLDDMLRMIFIHPALPEVARDAIRNARDQLHKA